MKAIIKMSLFFPILFFSGAADQGHSNIEIDTLYRYYIRYHEQHLSTVILSNEKELTGFLASTGFKADRAIKKPDFAPDFSKHTLFAFAGWPCTIINIFEDSVKIIVHYKEDYRNIDSDKGPEYSRPANEAVVYAISRTNKTIEFVEVSGKN